MPKKKLVLNFPPHLIGQAITYRLITDYGLVVNILRARITPQEWGSMVLELGDGNGRLARLLMNLALLQAGYNITIIPPIRRPDYINTLEKAHADDKPFTAFIAEMVMETQKDYIRLFEENKKIR